jgi:hypothetical protein
VDKELFLFYFRLEKVQIFHLGFLKINCTERVKLLMSYEYAFMLTKKDVTTLEMKMVKLLVSYNSLLAVLHTFLKIEDKSVVI